MALELSTILFAVTAIIVGSTLQRVSGAGVGLVVAPTLAILLGPSIGVFATNCVTIVSAAMLMLVRRREIEWRKAGIILLTAIPGSFAGAWLVRELSPAWLDITIGGIVMVALTVTLTANRLSAENVPGGIGVAGVIGGLFNTTAGIAAPALVVYSRLANWRQPKFGATLQPIFFGMGILSVLTKSMLGSTGFDATPEWWLLFVVIGAVSVGIGIGHVLSRRITPLTATRLALAVAGLGGLVAIIRGLGILLTA